MKYDFAFRIDVERKIGSGHFYRCLALANELVKRDKKIILLVKNRKDVLSHLKGIDLDILNLKEGTEKDCIKQIKNNLKIFRTLVVDLPDHNELYSKFFKNICTTVIIDDLGNKKIYSNMLFNGSVVNKYHNYEFDSSFTKVFRGPKYMILRDSFSKIRSKVKISKQKIKKILLTFGGSDEKNLTFSILQILSRKDYKLTVLLGPFYNQNKKLKAFTKDLENVKVEKSVLDISYLIARHDLVISSSGVTAYELACLGVPSIFIPESPHQIPTAISLMERGFGTNFGYWNNNVTEFENLISKMNAFEIRNKMYKAGRQIVDGKGVFRVADKLIKLS